MTSVSDRFQQGAEMSRWVDRLAGEPVQGRRYETIYADLH
jgi:hypothetical protein